MDNAPALDIHIPDNTDLAVALGRSTQLGIGAHPDDLEIMAIPGILASVSSTTEWFSGVVACDGAGSPRSGPYAEYSDQDMAARRREEQRERQVEQADLVVVERDVDAGDIIDPEWDRGCIDELEHRPDKARDRNDVA